MPAFPLDDRPMTNAPTNACGLDFGTSNSTFARVGADGVPLLLALEDGKPTIPSVLFFGFEDDRLHFGRQAVAEYVSGADGRLLRSLKSVLGTALIGDSTRVKARSYGFVEIIGLFIAELKRRAEAELGAGVDSVVCGRPVHFVDDDALADAAAQDQLAGAVRAQGFSHIEFQFEPIAAALDYERQVSGEKLALIVDLGGGTSDFSVVRVSPAPAPPIAAPISWPRPACILAAPTSTACSPWQRSCPNWAWAR